MCLSFYFFKLSTRILLWVKEKTRISPNLPSRTGEYMLGKISFLDLMTVIPVHFITTVSTAVFLQKLLPDSILPLALKPIHYEHDQYSLVMVRPFFPDLDPALYNIVLKNLSNRILLLLCCTGYGS